MKRLVWCGVSFGLWSVACGSADSGDAPEITTLEEARLVNRGSAVAAGGLEFEVVSYEKEAGRETTVSRAEGPCPGGSGTVHVESTNVVLPDGADFRTVSTYDECVVSDDLTLDGTLTFVTIQTADKNWTGTRSGTLETNLGVCVFDLKLEGQGESASLSERGTLCGIEYENSPSEL